MDWFLYDNGPRHERINYSVYKTCCKRKTATKNKVRKLVKKTRKKCECG